MIWFTLCSSNRSLTFYKYVVLNSMIHISLSSSSHLLYILISFIPLHLHRSFLKSPNIFFKPMLSVCKWLRLKIKLFYFYFYFYLRTTVQSQKQLMDLTCMYLNIYRKIGIKLVILDSTSQFYTCNIQNHVEYIYIFRKKHKIVEM